jgi:hypothetical protein
MGDKVRELNLILPDSTTLPPLSFVLLRRENCVFRSASCNGCFCLVKASILAKSSLLQVTWITRNSEGFQELTFFCALSQGEQGLPGYSIPGLKGERVRCGCFPHLCVLFFSPLTTLFTLLTLACVFAPGGVWCVWAI